MKEFLPERHLETGVAAVVDPGLDPFAGDQRQSDMTKDLKDVSAALLDVVGHPAKSRLEHLTSGAEGDQSDAGQYGQMCARVRSNYEIGTVTGQ